MNSFPENIYIGTSGWSYLDWVDNFYPKHVSSKDILIHYIKSFNSVEINNSFYRLPTVETAKMWLNNTPLEFLFAIKASRYITHFKKLKDPKDSVQKLFFAFKPLKKKLALPSSNYHPSGTETQND